MNYVYVVSDDCHGVVGYYSTKEKATEAVNTIASEWYQLPLNTPLDYKGDEAYGWRKAASWTREVLR